MTREEIFEVIKRNIREILYGLGDEEINIEASLKDLGANSIDRADIVTQSMADLQLKMSLIELGSARNISDLVDLFYRKQQA
ncbi:acyl carrier protein [Methylocaldum gracile]|uniref:acyl carrier protein n=1 Tax=unclassified Methylocaldum TaxID=2622260 RepID=UPI0010612EF4